MRFSPTPLNGVVVIDLDQHHDERGWFARSFCEKEFAAHGLPTRFPQHNLSFNKETRTLRGMHYQKSPHGEQKVVRCVRGAIFDVVVDIEPVSPTFRQWYGIELSMENRRMIYIPAGFAHGFLTLEANSEVSYMMGAEYHPASATGVHWKDPSIGISWPDQPRVISDRDAALPYLT